MPYVFRTLQELPLSEMNTDAAVPGLNRDNAYRLEVVLPDESVLSAPGWLPCAPPQGGRPRS